MARAPLFTILIHIFFTVFALLVMPESAKGQLPLPLFLITVLILPIMGLVIGIFLLKIKQNQYNFFLQILLIYMQILIFGMVFRINFDILAAMVPGLGVFFVIVGFLLPGTEQNKWVGIRTPWTLASKENWKKTHEFGKSVFIVIGFLNICSIIAPSFAILFLLVPLLIGIGILFTYSYKISKK